MDRARSAWPGRARGLRLRRGTGGKAGRIAGIERRAERPMKTCRPVWEKPCGRGPRPVTDTGRGKFNACGRMARIRRPRARHCLKRQDRLQHARHCSTGSRCRCSRTGSGDGRPVRRVIRSRACGITNVRERVRRVVEIAYSPGMDPAEGAERRGLSRGEARLPRPWNAPPVWRGRAGYDAARCGD